VNGQIAGRSSEFAVLESMDRTTVFTDGAAKGNPGRGGWGAIIISQTAS
jgi:hypothetical protein